MSADDVDPKVREAVGMPLDYGPVYMRAVYAEEPSRPIDCHVHLFEDCGLLEQSAEVEQYDALADVPRRRWLGSIGPLPPSVCLSCQKRRCKGR